MDREQVMRWVAAYEAAWRESDRHAVETLFTDDARYRRSPYTEDLVGHPAIKDFWVADEGETAGSRTSRSGPTGPTSPTPPAKARAAARSRGRVR